MFMYTAPGFVKQWQFLIIRFATYINRCSSSLILGIRGEVKVTVKVDFFVDSNKFRQSSCGVQFFYSECKNIVI